MDEPFVIETNVAYSDAIPNYYCAACARKWPEFPDMNEHTRENVEDEDFHFTCTQCNVDFVIPI